MRLKKKAHLTYLIIILCKLLYSLPSEKGSSFEIFKNNEVTLVIIKKKEKHILCMTTVTSIIGDD